MSQWDVAADAIVSQDQSSILCPNSCIHHVFRRRHRRTLDRRKKANHHSSQNLIHWYTRSPHPLTIGPFDGLPPNQPETDWFKTLRWRSLPGTKGAYDVALSLKLGGLYDSSKTLLSQVGQVDEVWYMAFHLRQNFWVRNPMATTGVNVDLELQVYGPDHVAIHQGKYKGTFNETKKGLWRVWF